MNLYLLLVRQHKNHFSVSRTRSDLFWNWHVLQLLANGCLIRYHFNNTTCKRGRPSGHCDHPDHKLAECCHFRAKENISRSIEIHLAYRSICISPNIETDIASENKEWKTFGLLGVSLESVLFHWLSVPNCLHSFLCFQHLTPIDLRNHQLPAVRFADNLRLR